MTTKTSTPVRIDADLYAEATSAAAVMSRSTAQHLAHWASIGRELEASPTVSLGDVAAVLQNASSYDTLNTEEQAVVRAFWTEKMIALRDALRLDEEYASEGRPYVELDESGQVVRHDPRAKRVAATSGGR